MASKHHQPGSNARRKVRVVAKVRGFSAPEPDFPIGSSRTVDWISVNKPQGEDSEGVIISFPEQSSSRYFVDYCYGQNEENELIYSREVKPLISSVFEGHNSSIIACGARGSGKTHLLKGSAEKSGLVVHAIAEFLSAAEENGKSIAISFYEVDHQEHAVDLFNTGQTPILVYEDRGKIQYKGLSQIPVKSIAEFQNLYLNACSAQKAVPKKGFERPRRSHRGLIVHVFSQHESVETGIRSKMTFVDLAGYEDTRKKSSDGTCLAETNKIHKSIHALMNVSHALSINESRVPYRESKLTRMLQDSLRGTSRILIVACLNPSFCQDSIYMLSLASRSCQSVQGTPLDSTKKSVSSVRQIVTSQKSQIPKGVSTTAKKIQGPKSYQSEKKAAVVTKSAIKGRKLFDEASHSAAKTVKKISMTQDSSEPPLFCVTQDIPLEKDGSHVEPNLRVEKDNSFPDDNNNVKLNLMAENDSSSLNTSSETQIYPIDEKDVSLIGEDHDDASSFSKALTIVEEGYNMNKENNSLEANEVGSQPISSQLRDLSNRLKLLCSSTPLSIEIPEKDCTSIVDQLSTDIVEPKTPVIEQTKSLNDRMDVINGKSPWQTFSMRSSGMKDSLVQEYLKFLNTANKEELKKLKGIGEKRATSILELRDESPEPFKSLDDLKDIGLSAKQIKGMMKKEVGELLFN